MYKTYFGLHEAPFSIAPDPRYLYMSERHREALAHLIYGVGDEGGFVVLTGEVGTGKTTVCRCLLEQLPEATEVALILNPGLTVEELLASICDELRIPYPSGNRSIKTFVDCLNAWLLDAHASGRHTVLIIDEAQNLSAEVLEQLRLLTNLETNRKKLLQIILLGQPELNDMLARSDLRQLGQRITARYHLTALSRREVAAYISHRLAVAGLARSPFSPAAIGKVAQFSHGTPRLINILCDRALLGAYAQEKRMVDARTVSKAAHEVFGNDRPPVGRPRRGLAWLAASILLLAGGAAAAYYQLPHGPIVGGTAGIPEKASDARIWRGGDLPEHGRASAFADLFALWGVDYDASRDGEACDFARSRHLDCLHDRGSQGMLRRLNRPAVLRLTDAGTGESYATATAISDDGLTLILGEGEQRLSARQLDEYWQGEFELLWQPPPGYTGQLSEGQAGVAVQWLARQLSRVRGGDDALSATKTLDGRLIDAIEDFQHRNGLEADGIAGPKTLILLNSAVGAAAPMLKPERG